MEFLGETFKEVCESIREVIGECRKMPEQKKADPQIRLKHIHKGLQKVKRGDVVRRYLISRGINKIPTHNLFTHTNLPYYGRYVNGEKVNGVFNAMVGRITNGKGELESYHITYLSQDAKKLDYIPAKIIITPITTISGCGVKFSPPSETLGITEGIETALAVEEFEEIACWAAISAGGMEKIHVPDMVKNVEIYMDNDANFAGQKAAYTLANSLSAKGKNVRVMCEWDIGEDYLDWANRSIVTSKAVA
jgi:putative DNA primase/helicase